MWLSLAKGKDAARAARDYLKDERHQALTSPATIAEVVSVLVRQGRKGFVNDILETVRSRSTVLRVDDEDFERAGFIHAAERSAHRDFSLADALLLALATQEGAEVFTTDGPLAKNRQGVKVRLLG